MGEYEELKLKSDNGILRNKLRIANQRIAELEAEKERMRCAENCGHKGEPVKCGENWRSSSRCPCIWYEFKPRWQPKERTP
jgi:hypothetical protein